MFLANRLHKLLLGLYSLVLLLAVWGILSLSDDSAQLPIAIWTAIGAVSAAGAILEVTLQLRTRKALTLMKEQIRKMADEAKVGLIMLEDYWPVAGLANMLNEYLTTLRNELDELSDHRRELDLLASAADAEKSNIESIIKSISDAVFVLNQFGELVLANRLAEQLFGIDVQHAQDRPIEDLIGEPKIAHLIRQVRTSNTQPNKCELWMKDVSAMDRCFEVTVCPVYTAASVLWATVVIMHDVTRERELAQLKNDFVNHVSHELKTPLTSIKAHVELLRDGEVDGERQRADFCRIILSESQRLERFIENILSLNRIESRLMPMYPCWIALSGELQRVTALVQPQAAEKQINLQYELAGDLDIWADKELLYQTILNLLSNAIKYTPAGGTVRVKAYKTATGDACIIEVIDNGIGIASRDQEKIFDKFYRSTSGSQAAGGSGLGLALAQKIVEELHGGTLAVESVPGKGSRFIVTLPQVIPNDYDTNEKEIPVTAGLTE